jgi:hypothetical protein
MQVLKPEDSGPRLNVEGLIWKAFPENGEEVTQAGVSKSQGTFQMSNSQLTASELVNAGPALVEVPWPIF